MADEKKPGPWRDPAQDTLEWQMLAQEYRELLHAVQSGISAERGQEDLHGISEDLRGSGPKHLRVGVNAALSDHGSLVGLLIRKGVITGTEYMKACVEGLRTEVESYERMLSQKLGTQIKLH